MKETLSADPVLDNAESIVAWLKAAQYLPEVQHRINVACDKIESQQRAIQRLKWQLREERDNRSDRGMSWKEATS